MRRGFGDQPTDRDRQEKTNHLEHGSVNDAQHLKVVFYQFPLAKIVNLFNFQDWFTPQS